MFPNSQSFPLEFRAKAFSDLKTQRDVNQTGDKYSSDKWSGRRGSDSDGETVAPKHKSTGRMINTRNFPGSCKTRPDFQRRSFENENETESRSSGGKKKPLGVEKDLSHPLDEEDK